MQVSHWQKEIKSAGTLRQGFKGMLKEAREIDQDVRCELES